MDVKDIHLKKVKYGKYFSKYEHKIYYKKEQIGEISFIKRNKILIIGFIGIFKEYRRNGYGYLIVEYLLSHYKVNCIVGEVLFDARGFWRKCIKKYNGERKNISYCYNCTSSFIIPKYDINKSDLYELLKIASKEM